MTTEQRTNALRVLTDRDAAECIWCERMVDWDPPAGPWPQVGDWHDDGDYGCGDSPSTGEDGTAGHLTLEDIRAIIADRDDAYESEAARS